MRRAIQLARNNPAFPFGAVIVDQASAAFVGEGWNRSDLNPTWHGEIDAINHWAANRKAGSVGQSNPQPALTLYTTAEPCPMCQSAILWSGIQTVVFGTSIRFLQSHGWRNIDILAEEIIRRSPAHHCTLIAGVLAEECNALFTAPSDEPGSLTYALGRPSHHRAENTAQQKSSTGNRPNHVPTPAQQSNRGVRTSQRAREKKGNHRRGPESPRHRCAPYQDRLDRLDVLGTRALGTPAFGERDLLTFVQVVETHALQARRVKEQVLLATRLDESKALVRQLFDASFGHLYLFPLKMCGRKPGILTDWPPPHWLIRSVVPRGAITQPAFPCRPVSQGGLFPA